MVALEFEVRPGVEDICRDCTDCGAGHGMNPTDALIDHDGNQAGRIWTCVECGATYFETWGKP